VNLDRLPTDRADATINAILIGICAVATRAVQERAKLISVRKAFGDLREFGGRETGFSDWPCREAVF